MAVNNRATWVGFRNALSVPVCARFAVRFAVLTVGVIEKVPLMVAQVVVGWWNLGGLNCGVGLLKGGVMFVCVSKTFTEVVVHHFFMNSINIETK